MTINIDTWASTITGKYLDLDGAPKNHPYQCHDVWLSYLYALGGQPGDGHAGGDGYTDKVWRNFPTYRPNLTRLFTKHTTTSPRRGDVVFWSKYGAVGGLPHVAVALANAANGRVRCVTQNPGAVQIADLTLDGVLGVLRPITTTNTEEENDMFFIRRNSAGKVYAWNPLTGKKRAIGTTEWNATKRAYSAAKQGLPIINLNAAEAKHFGI